MDLNEAINKLKEIKTNNQKMQDDSSSNIFAKSLSNFKNIIVGAMSDLTGLLLKNEPSVTVLNFPKRKEIEKVEIINFPKHKERPEVEKVEVINQPEFNLNLEQITSRIDDLIQKGIQLPPELKALRKSLEDTGKKNYDCVDELCKIVSKLKLNPTINVETPKVNIPAPIVNIPATKFPEFPKKMEISNLDLSELVKNLEEIITELQYSQQKGIHITNPGDFPVSPSIATFKDSTGKVTQVVLTDEGKIPVEITDELSGISLASKQLPNNHQVTVSNQIPAVETGLAKNTTLINNSQKTQVTTALINFVFDSIHLTEPDTVTEVYTYKLAGDTVATITIIYTDATKETLVSCIRS